MNLSRYLSLMTEKMRRKRKKKALYLKLFLSDEDEKSEKKKNLLCQQKVLEACKEE